MPGIEDELKPRSLFGGAIELAIPERLTDVSDFRPVPDHQEVFADGAKDQSLVVEVVEHDYNVANASCSRHLFEDLALQNDAVSATFESGESLSADEVRHLPSGTPVLLGMGMQQVSKGRQGSDAINTVQVLVAAVRLPQHKSDVVLSLNSPSYISEQSTAAADAGSGQQETHKAALPLFRRILGSLKIIDYGLFGGEG